MEHSGDYWKHLEYGADGRCATRTGADAYNEEACSGRGGPVSTRSSSDSALLLAYFQMLRKLKRYKLNMKYREHASFQDLKLIALSQTLSQTMDEEGSSGTKTGKRHVKLVNGTREFS